MVFIHVCGGCEYFNNETLTTSDDTGPPQYRLFKVHSHRVKVEAKEKIFFGPFLHVL